MGTGGTGYASSSSRSEPIQLLIGNEENMAAESIVLINSNEPRLPNQLARFFEQPSV